MGYFHGEEQVLCTQAIRQETALSQISDHARTAERIGDLIEGFIARCRGSGSACAECDQPAPVGYFADLSRLSEMLARAENSAGELANIG